MPRISQLPSLAAADNSDEIAIVDTSASVTKKITRGDLLKAPLPANAVTTASIADGAVTNAKMGTIWQSWTPTVTGFSGTPSVTARYSQVGKIVHLSITASGTSNSSDKFFTLPIQPAAWQEGMFGENAHTAQASNYIAGTLFDVPNNRIRVYRGFNQATATSMITPWATSGAASFTLHMTYEAA